jgi:uncharacterized protein
MRLLLVVVFVPFTAITQPTAAERQQFDKTKTLAEGGNADAQHSLAVMYHFGRGVEEDHAEAVKWFHKAAEQGHADAQVRLGGYYAFFGHGVEKDYVEAVKWFRKAAERGHAAAQTNLGLMYQKGLGVEQNYADAMKWYRMASEQGHADGQHELAMMYYEGQGVEKDYVEAYAWLNLASVSDKGAAAARDAIEKQVSAQQVADGQKRTKELKAIVEANKAKAAK